MTIASQIIARLNADDAVTYGLSCKDAELVGSNVVTFTYPAPVVGGACHGVITVLADGSIHDDTSDMTHETYADWLADLESMMQE